MYVFDRQAKQDIPAKVIPVTEQLLAKIQRSREFRFNWKKERESGRVCYALVHGDRELLGVMAVLVHSESSAVEICLLESAQTQIGKKKRYERIAGCMLAYACRISFGHGFGGFIYLIAKTNLLAHYQKQYGMRRLAGQPTCYLDLGDALRLMNEYSVTIPPNDSEQQDE